MLGSSSHSVCQSVCSLVVASVQLAYISMDVQIAVVKVVSINGFKAQWKIDPDDIIDVSDQPFVRLKPWSKGLQQLVSQNNELYTAHADKNKFYNSLSNSIGLSNMMQKRSAAKANKNNSSTCCLFEPAKAKPKRVSIEEKKQQRQSERSTLEISITVNGQDNLIDVLEPVHSQDALYVMCDATTLGLVIKYLRDEGFNDPKPKERLQPGIHKWGDRYMATFTDENGEKRHKVADTIDAALEKQASMGSMMMDQGHDDYDHDAEADGSEAGA